MYFTDYSTVYGDPTLNKLGHTRVTENGKVIVLCPSNKVGTMRISDAAVLHLSNQVAPSGNSPFGVDGVNEMFDSMVAGLRGTPSSKDNSGSPSTTQSDVQPLPRPTCSSHHVWDMQLSQRG